MVTIKRNLKITNAGEEEEKLEPVLLVESKIV
jgi:hypothetical protein